ncbi:MAG TPA: GNAT family N-acetyltransferase [Lacisediminihabitans sp.]|uniref:GNAT family N-acetyltransferase n=1 Tax=Lacisediminihabitans sp. TaxID=2787631 RepID=UPI002ED94744
MTGLRRFEIHPPHRADGDAIARVHVEAWRETYATLLPARFFGEDAVRMRQRMWASILDRDPLPPRLRVAEVDGALVGVSFGGPTRDDEPARALELYLIYLNADHHGSGVGQALLDAVLGDEPAQLWVAEDNPRARAFYRRNGFTPDGARKVDAEVNDLAEIRLVR